MDGESNRHKPNRFSRHLRVLANVMQNLRRSGFVGGDTLSARPVPASRPSRRTFILEGEIGCSGKIIVSVKKTLEATDTEKTSDPLVRTVKYCYVARIEGGRQLFRYDNADHHGFADPHHKHVYADTGEERPDSPVWIGAEKWPQVSDVVREAHLLYVSNFDRWSSNEFPATLRDRLDLR